jgi:cellulose synthase/poly-beta-1,6-N-acetylglucosamine synthase-like glycosyltransferase
MTIILWIYWTLIFAFIVIQILCLVWISIVEEEKFPDPEDWPKVSILLAARNEEKLILRSLEAMASLEYEASKLEILIGNDASTDKTRELIESFIENLPAFRLFEITKTMGKGRGKANVLAHLAHEASGEIYLITDVDVKLSKNWIKGMVRGMTKSTGIVSGTSMCERKGLFATLQSVDWLHFMGYIKSFARVGVSCTAVGNNMAVRAEAYWQTGGYESIDFSITEDYKLFKELIQRGWKWKTYLNADTLGLAWYIPSFKEMLHQRKRWLIGARELPLNWKILIILYGSFIPTLTALFILDPAVAIRVWILKIVLQSIFILSLCHKVDAKPFRFFILILYEFYVVLNTVMTAVFYLLPIKSVWKGRTYNKAYLNDQS